MLGLRVRQVTHLVVDRREVAAAGQRVRVILAQRPLMDGQRSLQDSTRAVDVAQQAEDALRVTVNPRPNEMEEALDYEFEDLKADSATVTLKWEKIAVPFKIAVSDETTFGNIAGQMRGRAQYEWDSCNQAANFCVTKKIHLEDGLKWVNLSIQNEERFENLATKTDLLKATNKPDEAKKWQAERAKYPAEKAPPPKETK